MEKEDEKLLWKKMSDQEKIDFLYRKQVSIREVVNKQSNTMKAVIKKLERVRHVAEYAKAAVAGLRLKIDTKKASDNPFGDIFSNK